MSSAEKAKLFFDETDGIYKYTSKNRKGNDVVHVVLPNGIPSKMTRQDFLKEAKRIDHYKTTKKMYNVGSKDEVYFGIAIKTKGKCTKANLGLNKEGKVSSTSVCKKKSSLLTPILPTTSNNNNVLTMDALLNHKSDLRISAVHSQSKTKKKKKYTTKPIHLASSKRSSSLDQNKEEGEDLRLTLTSSSSDTPSNPANDTSKEKKESAHQSQKLSSEKRKSSMTSRSLTLKDQFESGNIGSSSSVAPIKDTKIIDDLIEILRTRKISSDDDKKMSPRETQEYFLTWIGDNIAPEIYVKYFNKSQELLLHTNYPQHQQNLHSSSHTQPYIEMIYI